jgi:hypothetical protein
MTPKTDSILLIERCGQKFKMAQGSEGQTYNHSNPMPRYHLNASWRYGHQRRRAWNRPTSGYGGNDRQARAHRPRCGSTLAILERKKHWSAGAGLEMKKAQRTKVEQIERIVIALLLRSLITKIRPPTPNHKGSAGEHDTMSVTWVGNISAGLQESRGEVPCRDHI